MSHRIATIRDQMLEIKAFQQMLLSAMVLSVADMTISKPVVGVMAVIDGSKANAPSMESASGVVMCMVTS